ncbi:MAG: hypothetical protein IKC71_02730 [Clostridia bacterium]|nr:hypothetical protein [Clostridia bacterium]
MKKLITIFALLICSLLLFTGCTAPTPISYSANWFKDGKFIGSKQTYTYTVKNIDGFKHSSYDYSKVDNDVVTVNYGVGEYTVILETVYDLDENYKPFTSSYAGSFKGFYKLTTFFNIDVTFVYKSGSYSFTDTITSTCWFNEVDYYLQPIFHTKSYNTTSLDKNYNIAHSAYTSTINYNNGNAELTILNDSLVEAYPNDSKYSIVKATDAFQEVSYKNLGVIDNEELLFAVRCLPLAKDYAVSLNVFDTTHRKVKGVAVRVLAEEKVNTDLFKDNNFVVGGEPIIKEDGSIDTFVTSIVLNEKLAGSPKFCWYQKANKGLSDRALLVKFVDKLPNGLGALEYTLTSVNLEV